MSGSSSPLSDLVSVGQAAVEALGSGSWDDAVDKLDQVEKISAGVRQGEREVDQAVDALQHCASSLRDDAEKPQLRRNVTAERIADLEALTEDVAAAAARAGHEPTSRELHEAVQHPGPLDE